jgi:hypothetical protein
MNIFKVIWGFFMMFLKHEQENPPKPEEPVVEPTPIPEEPVMSGKKLALIVGINKYMQPGADLNGCVNDAEDMWTMLTEYGFEPDNIRMLTDFRATQQNILERLEWLVSNLEAGDTAFFHYSGHGSYIRARNGDTSELDDHQTEILCPTDLNWDDPLTDDILADYFKRVPEGAFLTFICDSCHSGTMSRGISNNPHEWVARYLAPPMDIQLRSRGRGLETHRMGRRANNTKNFVDNVCVIDQRHLLLSGCRDDQTSADAFVGGKWGGALSQNFLRLLKENKEKSWREIHKMVVEDLYEQRYSQVPQLTGPEKIIDSPPLS